MSAGDVLRDVVSASLQMGLVVLVATAAARMLPPAAVRARLAFWRGVLALCVVLPLVAPAPVAVARLAAFTASSSGGTADAGVPWAPLAMGVLSAGAFVKLLRVAIGVARLSQLRRRARALPQPARFLAELHARTGAHAWVGLSGDVTGPVTLGFWRAAVLLPPAVVELPEGEQRAVICHELVHVRRRDALWALVEELVAACLWFHPAILWLLGRIRFAREAVVDREAAQALGDRRTYLESLLSVARLGALPRPDRLLPAFLRHRQLERRVALLLEEVLMKPFALRARLVTGGVLVLAAAFAAGVVFPLRRPLLAAAALGAGAPDEKAKSGPQLRLLEKVEPEYPADARKDRVEGRVVAEVTLDRSGHVTAVKVVDGNPVFEASTRAALAKWRFEAPAKAPAVVTITIAYRLDSDKKGEK